MERGLPANGSHHGGGLHQFGPRAMDVAVALALVLLTLPVLALTALAVRLDSPGPVFSRTPYVGQGGRTFLLLTFRCTRGSTGRDGAPLLSRVGRLLRPVRLDQVPVLLNLLSGDLTLLGPAPELYRAGSVRAPRCKPGLLGWCEAN